MTVIDKYLRFFASTGVESSTVDHCGEVLKRLFRMLIKDYDVVVTETSIEGLDGDKLMEFYSFLSENRKISTRNNYVSMLNPFLKRAFKAKWIEEDLSNVLTTYKLPSPDKTPEWERKDKYITPQQVHDLLVNTPGRNKIRDQAIIALFLGTGIRVSELCSLTIGSILDHERGDLYLKRKGGQWKHTEVADFVYEYIDKYLATREDIDDHSRPLFMTTHGNPCSRHQIYFALSYKQKQMDLPTGPHALRHTFVSETEKCGGVAVARDLANHSSYTITNRYDHTTHEQRQEAVNALPWA